VPKEQTVFEEYHESTNYSNLRTNSETLTSKDIETQLLNGIENSNSLVYFYKPHCGSCYMVSRSFEEMGKELNVISTFAKDVSEGKVNYRNFDENILNHHRI
jgi:thiol-disulfide isomerase/thioredoxin